MTVSGRNEHKGETGATAVGEADSLRGSLTSAQLRQEVNQRREGEQCVGIKTVVLTNEAQPSFGRAQG